MALTSITDQNGMPLAVGDHVSVDCQILGIHDTIGHANLELATLTPMFPGEYGTRLLLRGQQVVRGLKAEQTPPKLAPETIHGGVGAALPLPDAFGASVPAPLPDDDDAKSDDDEDEGADDADTPNELVANLRAARKKPPQMVR